MNASHAGRTGSTTPLSRRASHPTKSGGFGRSTMPFARLSCLLLLLLMAPEMKAQHCDLCDMSLEDLLTVKVTTAEKKQTSLARTTAAVYVITADDIVRSGATSVADALRLAPGVEVAQISSSLWAISIRGFNGRYANKLLVLVDGRSVYTTISSGVYWNVQDLLLEDVERIEVIRGPGAAVWGANAVNGVINIITYKASQTQGGLLSVTGGSHDQAVTGVRYGAQLGSQAAYRVFGRYALRGQTAGVNGGNNYDRWNVENIGFRSDWSGSSADSFMVEGSVYQARSSERGKVAVLGPPFVIEQNHPTITSGGSLLFHWKHTLAGGSELGWQAYYDDSHRGTSIFGTTDRTLDVDFQDESHLGSRHDVVWGLGFRLTDFDSRGSVAFSLNPAQRITNLFSGFGQDEITLLPDRLSLTLGAKLEHNAFTGLELQPDARLLWTPHPRHAVWAAVSRAARTPSSFEEGARLNIFAFPNANGMVVLGRLVGNPHFKAEHLLSYELGYRTQASKRLSFDITGFYNLYHSLATDNSGTPFFEAQPSPAHLVLPVLQGNSAHGHSLGFELASNYSVTSSWKVTGSYSSIGGLVLAPPGADPEPLLGSTPEHQFQLHSAVSLPRKFEFDTGVYFVGALRDQPVRSYTRLDARLAWSPAERVQLSLGFENLLDPRHLESIDPSQSAASGLIGRSVSGKAVWRF